MLSAAGHDSMVVQVGCVPGMQSAYRAEHLCSVLLSLALLIQNMVQVHVFWAKFAEGLQNSRLRLFSASASDVFATFTIHISLAKACNIC